jgi:hypothetical protein
MPTTTHAERVQSVRDLADWLEMRPEMHAQGYLRRHVVDGDEFDRLAAVMGAEPYEVAHHAVAEIKFGDIVYGIQTAGGTERALRAREARIAAREAELGLANASGADPTKAGL